MTIETAASIKIRDYEANEAKLAAARYMLAVLKAAFREIHNPGAYRVSHNDDLSDVIEAAIAAAKCAGITT